MKKLCLFASILVISIVSCKASEAEPIKMPIVSEVDLIEIREENKVLDEIKDNIKIKEVLDFISRNNRDWYRPWGTFPGPQTTVVFRNKATNPILILWFGPNWIGGIAMPQGPKGGKLWDLEETKLQELRKLLSI